MIILHPFRTRKDHPRNQTHSTISVAAISILYLSATTVSSLLFAKTTAITAFRYCGAKTRSVYRLSSRSSSVSDMFQTNKNVTTDRTSSNTTTTSFTVGNRIEQTAEPCVILMKQITSQYADLWKDKGGIYSLAQGIVYWAPPPTAYTAIANALTDSNTNCDLHLYNPAGGIPDLVEALKEKLRNENCLENVSVMVTAGANQAYMNCILTLLNEGQTCVLFQPYYFNHLMAVQMTWGEDSILVGPTNDDGIPDADWLEQQLVEQQVSTKRKIQMVTLVDPCNPTGIKIPNSTKQRIVNLCQQYGVWLVMDNTYEHFDHTSLHNTNNNHLLFPCPNYPHVIHIFSFSKGYSLARFRVGYLTVSNTTMESRRMYHHMLKVQDTIPICASRISQLAALGAMQSSGGRQWVMDQVATLKVGREAVKQALSSLEQVIGGSGAMYFMAKLPFALDDVEFATTLVRDYGVAVIPGSFCGAPGWIRVCYSNLEPSLCKEAAERLAKGIQSISAGRVPDGR